MARHGFTGPTGRLAHSPHHGPPRSLAALGLSLILAAGCGSPGPVLTSGPSASGSLPTSGASVPGSLPTSGASAPGTSPSASPLVVGAPGASPSLASPAPTTQPVEFEVKGDESNGWWWLQDATGSQQASWGFPDLPTGGSVTLDFQLLAADAANDGGTADARLWLTYGGVVDNAAQAAGSKPVLVALANTSAATDPSGNAVSGHYTISSADMSAQARGMWVRVGRVGPDGTVLPERLAVAKSSVRIAGSSDGQTTPVPPPPPGTSTNVDFAADGDAISGWWWLRDDAGTQHAGWGFMGTPNGQPLRIDFALLATDTINGGRGVDARFWLTYRTIVEGGGGGPLSTPQLIVLKNNSPADDPVGYSTAGFVTVPVSALASGAIGFWVGISRRGPDGRVLSGHIAVREASVTVSGLGEGPTASPEPTTAPSANPTASPNPYGALTITTSCQEYRDAPLVVSGSAAPDLHLEFAPTESFATIYASDSFVLSPPGYTYESMYGVAAFPTGIWVRYAGDHSVKAHATNKGYCAGWTPQPTASPTPTAAATFNPPAGDPTIVALGDSYISGEAGRWAGNSYDWYGWTDAGGSGTYDNASSGGAVIAGCHRSVAAEVHIDRGGYGHVVTINLACSGATTQSRADSGSGDKPGIDNCPNDIHRSDCPAGVVGQAATLTDQAGAHNVKLVVLSIGGNDFSFSDTVVQCSMDHISSSYFYDTDYCHDDGSVTDRFSSTNIAAVKTKLVNAYEDIVLAMREASYPDSYWSLLIQNYPSPLPRGNGIRYDEWGFGRFNNGCPFWNQDADWANDTALPTISNTINAAVAQFRTTYPGVDVHVMDVSQALMGHRLCENTVGQVGLGQDVGEWTDGGASDGSEWVAQIRGVFSVGGKIPLPGSVYYKNESFHPNYWGQLALRDCLRQAWNNGNVRGGTCQFMQNGLNAFGEPTMILSQP
jgi:hypothetical protein